MFGKILYPTDFSDVSIAALDYVKMLKEAGTEEVIILHVLDERDVEAMVEGCLMREGSVRECEEETISRMVTKAKEKIGDIADELSNSGLDVRVMVKIGKPSREIVKVANEEDVSLIVMGTHGHSCLREAFVGSVAENVIHYTSVPVLLVRRR